MVHITFLDLRLVLSGATNAIISSLYSKTTVFDFPAPGIEHAKSNTSTAMFATVFASECLRFYAACSEFKYFIKNAAKYFKHFLTKGYPAYYMLSALRRVFRRHEHGKYGHGTHRWCQILRKITNKAAHTSYRRKRPAPPQNDEENMASTLLEEGKIDESEIDNNGSGHSYSSPSIAIAPTTANALRFTRFISGGIVQSTNGKCIFVPAPPRSATRTVPSLPGQHYVPSESTRVKKRRMPPRNR